MSPIKGLSEKRVLPRLGKIHLGEKIKNKNGIEYPQKTDYFVFPKDNPHYKILVETFGEKPKELRILIPVEDEEKWASQYYRCYSQTRGLICKGNGETAMRMVDKRNPSIMADKSSTEVEMREVLCKGRDCLDYKIKCKEVMNLQFLLPEIPGLGVWQIDTGSINSIKNVNSMADLIKGMYGRIHGIPLLLTLEPREVNEPKTGKKLTVFVMHLRTNLKLADVAIAARQQDEALMLEMPVSDDEVPEGSTEWEPSGDFTPMSDEKLKEVIEVAYPQKPESKQADRPADFLDQSKAEAKKPMPATDQEIKAVKAKARDKGYNEATWKEVLFQTCALGTIVGINKEQLAKLDAAIEAGKCLPDETEQGDEPTE